jgi:hypothetical protein
MEQFLEDTMLMAADASRATASFPHHDVVIKNTFIQVKDAEDDAPGLTRHRHSRANACAS